MRRENFDRDHPSEARIGRPVDLAHAAFADGGDHLVRAEPSSRRKGHAQLRCFERPPL
jgi:hypothetical protein